MRQNPHLYEINTWPWVANLSRRYGHHVTLGTVPDEVWDTLRARGVDLVYLMGIWTRSAYGRRIARSDPGAWASYDSATPAWRIPDVVGSAFCISGYEPDPQLGSMADLDRARAALNARGMKLIVDFIPNHFGFDHPWTTTNPERFVRGSEEDFRAEPTSFRLVERAGNEPVFIARARDPYFLPWSDVAQIDYSKMDTRRAMIAELRGIASHADGVRCDMAMLVLSDVFASTWRKYVDPWHQDREFWEDARTAVPGFLLLAEVYWDMEWRLQQLGFDYTYDKRLYDRLLHEDAGAVRGHLTADPRYQARSARFVENHDEARSADAFGPRTRAMACVVNTIPGLRFSYDGQWEGRRVRLPMQLGRDVDEPADVSLAVFYERLMAVVDDPVFHEGEWSLCDVRGTGEASHNILAWQWKGARAIRLVVVNLGHGCADARVVLGLESAHAGERFAFDDLMSDRRYSFSRAEIEEGVPVRLPVGGCNVFSVAAEPAPTA